MQLFSAKVCVINNFCIFKLDAAKHKKPEEDDLKDLNKLLKPVTDMPKIAKGNFRISVK